MTSTSTLALDNQLCFSLYRAQRLMTRTYQDLLKELGLTYPQYLTMLVLWETQGSVTMKELAARLELDSGTLTPLVKRLVAMGLVSKERDVADERRAVLLLTDAGAALRSQAEKVPGQIYTLCNSEGLDLHTVKGELDALSQHLSKR
ncbi:MarR family transcriptional regulator [Rothia sp. (in: high G+C Gram-positive bacteria)]|uniref:MarR family winged helix-turn-helix transcriptional regulator n=1 Tax=Rothia sp. (in: high G+C Gram-positive bacteria) TaxID=1885016 RepID=UPI00321790B2